jgi:hypothetical protein
VLIWVAFGSSTHSLSLNEKRPLESVSHAAAAGSFWSIDFWSSNARHATAAPAPAARRAQLLRRSPPHAPLTPLLPDARALQSSLEGPLLASTEDHGTDNREGDSCV